MANVPVNSGGVLVTAGNSASGSFGGMLALAGGPSASITGLKYVNGFAAVPETTKVNVNGVFTPGISTGFNNFVPVETTISTAFGLANGSKLEILITSCSLAAGSSPVFLYS